MLVDYCGSQGLCQFETDVCHFYFDVAKKMSEEEQGKTVEVTVSCDQGQVSYKVSQRSGTQFITEVSNTLPEDFQAQGITDRYLTCVNEEKNSYKFYQLTRVGKNTVRASYGRMGTKKGELFGERSFDYPLSMYWVKYFEKIGKGYIDQSELYLVKDAPQKKERKEEKKTDDRKRKTSGVSFRLFQLLGRFSKSAVVKAKVQVPITSRILKASEEQIQKMREAATVEEFNSELKQLIAILQRPVKTGDGMGVKELLAQHPSDFGRILSREEDLLDAMKGVYSGGTEEEGKTRDFSDFDIEVYAATEEQKRQVLSKLSPSLKPKVANVYRVIPKKQQEKFNRYLEQNQIREIRQFWHGSRNQNWLSIVLNSLQLNPSAVITGKMFGYGIYFAPSSMKSWNYTSFRGTTWAGGSSDTAWMGLYAVAYGKPYDVYTHDSGADYLRLTRQHHCNCLHAHAGSMLRNDEVVFYDEAAVVLNYLVEFRDA